ncbi:MAG: L,D-transpeptidase/peptidoglycan binding protein [Dorea sp.]|nr:L,D-transpeptidase/peptidoglycan binding protein [Dorea sp.]
MDQNMDQNIDQNIDQNTDQVQEKEIKPKKKWNTIKILKTIILLLIVAGLIVAACFYVYFVQYYTEHFYEGTVINGIDCSDLTEDEAASLLQNEINAYSIKVRERYGAKDTIDAEQIGMTYENDGSLKDLYTMQQPLLWAIKAYGDKTYEVPSGFVYDEKALRDCFDNFKQVSNFVPVKDAEMVQNEDGSYRIVKEVKGTQMDQEAAYAALVEAIKKQEAEIDLEEFYLNPSVCSDDPELVEEVEKQNLIFSLTRANIRVQFDDNEMVIDEETLRSWIVQDKTEKYKVDETFVRDFVQNLYDTYNVGHEGELFKTVTGKVVTLKSFEERGWDIDVDKSTERYMNAIREGYQGILGPVMTRLDDNGNETVSMYVEISIDDQMMWLIKDGEILVETPIVSGGADASVSTSMDYIMYDFNGRSTPSNGIWLIKKKESPHYMKGPMLSNGQYEYTLDVTYWLPFNDQVGIHDNYQRVDFGGNIYQTSGSHGCINTPFDAVETIYNTVDVGTFVIVYGKDTAEEVFGSSSDSAEDGAEEEIEAQE